MGTTEELRFMLEVNGPANDDGNGLRMQHIDSVCFRTHMKRPLLFGEREIEKRIADVQLSIERLGGIRMLQVLTASLAKEAQTMHTAHCTIACHPISAHPIHRMNDDVLCKGSRQFMSQVNILALIFVQNEHDPAI